MTIRTLNEQTAATAQRRFNMSWMPIIIQSIVLLFAAFSYVTTMEHRFTMIESAVRTNADILQELKLLNAGQDTRLQLLENTQGRILAIEEYTQEKLK